MKLMIVDDDRQIREGIRYGIDWETVGIDQVRDYPNGRAALEELKDFKPDIILADIRMPQMNGLEFLHEVRKFDSEARFLILSAYADFDYAREALRNGANDYELKPVRMERLIQLVDRQVRDIREMRLQMEREEQEEKLRYALYHPEEERDLSEIILGLLGKAGSDRPVRILVNKIRIEYGDEREIGKSEVEHELEGMADYFGGIFLRMERDRCKEIILFFCPGTVSVLQMYQQKIEIKNRIQAINERMKEERVTATAGISDGHSSRGIYRAWQEAGEALEESFYIGRGAVIFWEGLREDSIWTEEKTEVLCKAVLQAGERADKEALGQAVTKLKRYAADARPGKGQLKEFLMRIVHELTKNMEDYLSPEGMRTAWEQAEYLEEYIQAFGEFLLEVADQKAQKQRLDLFSPTVAAAVKYLEKHFSEPVTIEKVAEELKKSPNYLSSIFKRETGRPFTDYLLRIRMEEARRLLQNTSFPVKMIAERVGYSDYVYFSKLFKKTFGCSASDCRNQKI